MCSHGVAVLLLGLFLTHVESFSGSWTGHPANSSVLPLFTTVNVTITNSQVNYVFSDGEDTISQLFPISDVAADVNITNRVYVWNVFQGFRMPVGESLNMRSSVSATELTQYISFNLEGSQGPDGVWELRNLSLDPQTNLLSLSVSHSFTSGGSVSLTLFPVSTANSPMPAIATTTPDVDADADATAPPDAQLPIPGVSMPPILPRGSVKCQEAFVMYLDDDWDLRSNADEKALLLSLQGLSNRHGPLVYFVYPPDWTFDFTTTLFDYYANQRQMSFTNLTSVGVSGAVKALVSHLHAVEGAFKGYVVYDPLVRVSLDVAFTVAGLEAGLVVSERLIPIVKAAGLSTQLADFRGQFDNATDVEAYGWAFDTYGHRTAKNLTIWTGGECGDTMHTAVADIGIMMGAFHAVLSTRTTDVDEYNLAKKIMSSHDPYTMVIGWHAYCKDLERTLVSLTSSLGLRVEGLNSNPNLSFANKVPTSPGFVYKNNHNVESNKTYIPPAKALVTSIQTDGLGLGAWNKPGRGTIDYAWETIINYAWLAPGRLEFFYSNKTSRDFFIGALSCPGYCYPKAIPSKLRPHMLELANTISTELDITVFEVMDYSQGSTISGNTDLTLDVVQDYESAMPSMIGFLNGYSPSYTFNQKPRPLLSFDFYLDPSRTVQQSIDDIIELSRVNHVRPYYLTMHVREFGDVERTKEILAGLPTEDFDVVPLDLFLKFAMTKPTFKNHALPE